MIYLDYSATTPVSDEVLDTFNAASLNFVGNANSIHTLGRKSNKLVTDATLQIASLLKIKPSEIIYTSGASESNNLAIKGICTMYKNRGKHVVTTKYEHSSVSEVMNYLSKNGYEITYLNGNKEGHIELEELKNVIRDDTILVSINAVDSEMGLVQNITEIGEFLKNYPKCFFHVDLTQMIGKMPIDLCNVDLASFSAHKFFGIKGIGCLVKKDKIEIEPLIHGGNSTTKYRSGTPAHPLIASLSKALRLSFQNTLENYEYVKNLNLIIRNYLKNYEDVIINSNLSDSPYILNVSIKGIKSETFVHALEEFDVYVSTKTACSDKESYSKSVYNLTGDLELAKSSIRISLSYITTEEEISKFLNIFDICYKRLKK